MYNLGNNTDKPKSSFIDIGIHENISVDMVRFGISENNNKFIAIDYIDDNGNKLTRTEWEPKGKTDEETLKKVTTQMARLEQFLYTFIPETTKFTATNFTDFANRYIQVLGSTYKNVKVRLKVVYDRKNWTSTPEYGKYKWIEPMSVPTDKSKIRILTIDKMSRDSMPKMENQDQATKEQPKDSLPF